MKAIHRRRKEKEKKTRKSIHFILLFFSLRGMSRRAFTAGAFVSLHEQGRDWLVKSKEHKFRCIQTRGSRDIGSTLLMEDEMGRQINFIWKWDGITVNQEFETIDFDKYFHVDGDGVVFFNKFNAPSEVYFNTKGPRVGPLIRGA